MCMIRMLFVGACILFAFSDHILQIVYYLELRTKTDHGEVTENYGFTYECMFFCLCAQVC